ncbi:acid protease [Byssothecium circinans]|uniref:Acid protease n=1 Tax=Byssothecium circinans TaxID=147558 RepID=A0A6A5TJ17_9PLEO|nr:acid protease [Byssothecium circinans]
MLTPVDWRLVATVDTGSPNLYLPSTLYKAIAAPLNVSMHPNTEGVPTPYVPCTLCSSDDSLELGFAGRGGSAGPKIRMPYREMIYRFGTPAPIGEVKDEDGNEMCYLGVIPWDGNDIVLVGAVLTRNAYVVFDGEELELRMAQVKTATLPAPTPYCEI